MEETGESRYFYIDNLRLILIVFVVMVHLAVTYSGIGSWYYKEDTTLDTISLIIFGFFQSFTQGYFMGLLFLIAGYFVPKSYDRKGFRLFISERSIRLGIPTLLYMLMIHPFNVYVLLNLDWVKPKPGFFIFYSQYIRSLDFIGSSGPLWFALALFIFCHIYAWMRLLSNKEPILTEKSLPGTVQVIGLIILIFAATFIIRLVQPIDTSILNMQLCFFSQYIILFTVGVYVYRNNWLDKLNYQWGRRWLQAGIIFGSITWAIIMLTGGALEGKLDLIKGGLYWQSAAYALWESFIAVSMSIGLLSYFKENVNFSGKRLKAWGDSSFAVYVFHALIIIALSILLKPLMLWPVLKFILLCLIGIPLCFFTAHYIFRKVPLLKSIL